MVKRDWVWTQLQESLANEKSRGVLLSGGPGSGKTSLVLSLVESSCFGALEAVGGSLPGGTLAKLAGQLVGYHFCQADNAPTCLVPHFVHSLAAQLSQAPQLASYYRHLKTSPTARALVALPSCQRDPSEAFVQGVLRPLARLHSLGQIPASSTFFLVVDGLCEAEQHRPDNGPTVNSFLADHLDQFPPWLKLIATARQSSEDSPTLDQLTLDGGPDSDSDLREYVGARCAAAPSIMANVRGHDDARSRLSTFLCGRARGCFLYVQLILDFIERGSLVIKSSSFKVLPQTLSEVFHLAFNLKFSSSSAYGPAGELLATALACLNPPSLQELHSACSALTLVPLPWADFNATYQSVAEWLVRRADGSVMLFHPTLRDWLLARRPGDSTKFLANVRLGHTAMALALARPKTPLRPEKMLELGHHILKAGLFKALDGDEHELSTRELQASFLALACGDPSPGLACPRNLHAPLTKVSRLLLLAGADPDLTTVQDEEPCSLLALHSGRGHLEMVSLLLEYCAQVTTPDGNGPSPLVMASMAGHADIARLLLACGASETKQALEEAGEGQDALLAALAHNEVEVATWLLSRPEVSHSPPKDESRAESPMEVAASAGSLQGVQLLLGAGASPRGGALHKAVEGRHWSVAELLLDRGAEPDLLDSEGRSPLSLAALADHCGLIELLVGRGACPEGGEDEAVTPLGHAILQGQQEVVCCLLELGASPNKGDKLGRSILDLAVHTCTPELVATLLQAGAELEQRDGKGIRPLDRAIALASVEVVSVFLRHGARLGATTWATAEGKPEIQLVLLNKVLEDGNCLYRKGRMEEAEQRYRCGLRKVPSTTSTRLGNLGPAMAKLELHFLLNLSRCERRQGRAGEALQLASRALSLRPDCTSAMMAKRRAEAAVAKGRPLGWGMGQLGHGEEGEEIKFI